MMMMAAAAGGGSYGIDPIIRYARHTSQHGACGDADVTAAASCESGGNFSSSTPTSTCQ